MENSAALELMPTLAVFADTANSAALELIPTLAVKAAPASKA